MSASPQLLPIGVLSSLSGVPPETIRTWERRYALLVPTRDASGRRRYDPGDVKRLQMIATLVAEGERFADLARLSHEELRQRRNLHGAPLSGAPVAIRAAVVHATLGSLLAGDIAEGGCQLEVVASAGDARALGEPGPVDVLVLDLAALGPDPVSVVDELVVRLKPTCTLVLYYFLSRSLRRSLQHRALRLVPAQLPIDILRRLALDALSDAGARSPARAPTSSPAPRFSRVELEALAIRRADLQCECPNHIAKLTLALREFEQYSRGCASQSGADAALHRELANGTASACLVMEGLLAKVCAFEGIPQ